MERNGSTGSPCRRSIGVTIWGVAFLAVGLLSFLFIWNFSIMHRFTEQIELNFVIPALILSITIIVAGIGVLYLKEWARYLSIISALIFAVLNTINYIRGLIYYKDSIDAQDQIISILFFLSIIPVVATIYFFTRPKVKAQFSPER